MGRFDKYLKEEYMGKTLMFEGNEFPWEALEAAIQVLTDQKWRSSPKRYLQNSDCKATEEEIWNAMHYLIWHEGLELRSAMKKEKELSPLARRMVILEMQLEYAKQMEKMANQVYQEWVNNSDQLIATLAASNLDFARYYTRQIQRQIDAELPV